MITKKASSKDITPINNWKGGVSGMRKALTYFRVKDSFKLDFYDIFVKENKAYVLRLADKITNKISCRYVEGYSFEIWCEDITNTECGKDALATLDEIGDDVLSIDEIASKINPNFKKYPIW